MWAPRNMEYGHMDRQKQCHYSVDSWMEREISLVETNEWEETHDTSTRKVVSDSDLMQTLQGMLLACIDANRPPSLSDELHTLQSCGREYTSWFSPGNAKAD